MKELFIVAFLTQRQIVLTRITIRVQVYYSGSVSMSMSGAAICSRCQLIFHEYKRYIVGQLLRPCDPNAILKGYVRCGFCN